jgi:hypothetical protein
VNSANLNNIKLNSAEISHLWNSYIFESMVHHVFSYLANTAEDYDVKTFTQYCHLTSRLHVNHYINIFKNENIPIPRGITTEDVNIDASKLFSDNFTITYIKSMAKFALTNFSMAYSESRRDDIRKLFRDHLERLLEIEQVGTEIVVAKGIYSEPPRINVRSEVEFIEKESFFAGFFGEKRSLSALEIKHLYVNTANNALGKALLTAFSMVNKAKEVKDYILKGKDMAEKYVNIFSDKLSAENITPAPSLEPELLTYSGSVSPFSDRLMLNHTVLLNEYGIANYSMALAQSMRRDLTAMYGKVIIETGIYADNGADLLVQHKWLEQPPLISKP